MPKRVLDTNILLSFWNHCSQKSKGRFQAADARRWAKQLISFHNTNAILTPIYIEVLAGVTNAKEATAWEAFLAEFACVDRQQLFKED
jgi:hypothetical protein